MAKQTRSSNKHLLQPAGSFHALHYSMSLYRISDLIVWNSLPDSIYFSSPISPVSTSLKFIRFRCYVSCPRWICLVNWWPVLALPPLACAWLAWQSWRSLCGGKWPLNLHSLTHRPPLEYGSLPCFGCDSGDSLTIHSGLSPSVYLVFMLLIPLSIQPLVIRITEELVNLSLSLRQVYARIVS